MILSTYNDIFFPIANRFWPISKHLLTQAYFPIKIPFTSLVIFYLLQCHTTKKGLKGTRPSRNFSTPIITHNDIHNDKLI